MKNYFAVLLTLFLFSGCSLPNPDSTDIDELVDQWHKDAAKADFDAYFKATNKHFVFLGTAPGERWNREDFMSFCKPYFDKGKAWNFKPSNRIVQFSKNGKTAWFDEDLDTWMKGCRGTGICEWQNGEWSIAYYNLHVLIENEKIEAFIDLREEPLPTTE